MICSLEKNFTTVENLFAFIQQFVRAEAIDDDTAFQLTVAAEELFTNLIKYSHQGSRTVTVRLERQEDWLELQLIDYGAAPFDVVTAQLSDLNVPIEQRRAGGMGLHLVRSFADELSYHHTDGNGVITFRKRLGFANV